MISIERRVTRQYVVSTPHSVSPIVWVRMSSRTGAPTVPTMPGDLRSACFAVLVCFRHKSGDGMAGSFSRFIGSTEIVLITTVLKTNGSGTFIGQMSDSTGEDGRWRLTGEEGACS